MAHINPPYRADHVGSFLRSSKIVNARRFFQDGKISKAELTQIEDEEIYVLVKQEIANGLKAVTDGEFRRAYWHLDFLAALNGIEHIKAKAWSVAFADRQPKAETIKISGKIAFSNDHPFLEAFSKLKSIAGEHEVKFTIPETYTKAGTLSLPLQILIQNEAGDKLTYTDTIEIDYALASEIPSEPDIDVVSVDVTWGAMEFTYTDGIWNAQSYTYEGFGWTDNGTGYVTVSNTGTAAATAAFTFDSDREEISGSFTDGTNTIADSVDIAVDQSQTAYLLLSGKPVEELNNTKIGTVTVRIGGE